MKKHYELFARDCPAVDPNLPLGTWPGESLTEAVQALLEAHPHLVDTIDIVSLRYAGYPITGRVV